MKQSANTKINFRLFENFVRRMSKGYYADFGEYDADHTKPDDENDHSKEKEGNDYTDPNAQLTDKTE